MISTGEAEPRKGSNGRACAIAMRGGCKSTHPGMAHSIGGGNTWKRDPQENDVAGDLNE